MKDKQQREIARYCGQRIQALREHAHLSQEELAEKLHCSRETVGKAERGIQMMKTWRLIELSNLFHVSLDYLLRDYYESDLSPVPGYIVDLYEKATPLDLEILNDHLSDAVREMDRFKRYIGYADMTSISGKAAEKTARNSSPQENGPRDSG